MPETVETRLAAMDVTLRSVNEGLGQLMPTVHSLDVSVKSLQARLDERCEAHIKHTEAIAKDLQEQLDAWADYSKELARRQWQVALGIPAGMSVVVGIIVSIVAFVIKHA